MDLFENAVFMLWCERVKVEHFESADVTALIYDLSEHVHGSLEILQGDFDCLFSFIKVQITKFEISSVFVCCVDGDIFQNAPRVDVDIFHMDKNRCVFKNIWTHVDKTRLHFKKIQVEKI